HWMSLIFALSAVRVLLPARTTFRVAIAGALLGIATFCTQTAGVFALLAIAASLVWEHLLSKKSHRSAVQLQALLVIAFIAVWISLSAPYIASVGWKHFWYLQVTYPRDYVIYPHQVLLPALGIPKTWSALQETAQRLFIYTLLIATCPCALWYSW